MNVQPTQSWPHHVPSLASPIPITSTAIASPNHHTTATSVKLEQQEHNHFYQLSLPCKSVRLDVSRGLPEENPKITMLLFLTFCYVNQQ